MGHERLGLLPKSRKWRDLIAEIGNSELSNLDTAEIARRTLTNVRNRYEKIPSDSGVLAAFGFLVAFAVSTKSNNPQSELENLGIYIRHEPTPLSVTRAAHSWIYTKKGSLEYAKIAQYAAGDALINFYNQQKDIHQPSLFEVPIEPYRFWIRSGDGAGFCELSRLFFAKFTERYLNYFLEREATSAIQDINQRDKFKVNLKNQLDAISKHAFETSKITQSFAAGWFNKHTKEGIPNEEKIKAFLSYAFEKIREELYREAKDDNLLS